MQKGNEFRRLVKTVLKKRATGVISNSACLLSLRQLPRKAFPAELPPPPPEEALLSALCCFPLSEYRTHLSTLEKGVLRQVHRPTYLSQGSRGSAAGPQAKLPRTLGKKGLSLPTWQAVETNLLPPAIKNDKPHLLSVIQRCFLVLKSVTTANQFQVAL